MPHRLGLAAALLLALSAGRAAGSPTRAAGELLWPLQQAPAERRLSSSFCEDRGSHLHGGVDLSTGGLEGIPVVAVAGGAIVRVKVAWRGLGRAVYVQHAGGLMTVYGHLAGFAAPLRPVVEGEMARRGRYPGDLFLDRPIPVEAGQVIAWSGKTGGGPPHLHFETRRRGGAMPVDPFEQGLPCPDREAPRLRALAILPAGPSAIPGEPLRIDLEGPRGPAPIVGGPLRLLARIEDPMGAGTGGLRFLEARLGGRELVRVDAAAFTYPVSRFTGHLHARAAPVPDEDEPCSGCWFWLAALPGSELPFVTGLAEVRVEPLPAAGPFEPLLLEITARDGCGNTARTEVELARAPRGAAASPAPSSTPGSTPSAAPSAAARSLPPCRRAAATPAAGGRLLLAGGGRLDIPAAALGEEISVADCSASAELPPVPEGLRLVASARLEPAWLPLARKAEIRFAVPTLQAHRARLAVYRFHPALGAWQLWGNELQDGSHVGTVTDRLGVFALLSDESPPRLAGLDRRRVSHQPWRDDADELVVRYTELGAGLDWDGIRFRPAGSELELIAEHDPDLQAATFALPPDLAGRGLAGRLVLLDRAGHRSEQDIESPAETRPDTRP